MSSESSDESMAVICLYIYTYIISHDFTSYHIISFHRISHIIISIHMKYIYNIVYCMLYIIYYIVYIIYLSKTIF